MIEEKQPEPEEQDNIETDIESLSQALGEEKARAEDLLANCQRFQADFINYKRRAEQERRENSTLSKSAVIVSLLPVLDDLERAIAAIPPRLAKNPWVEGVGNVHLKFLASLETMGVKQVKTLGKPFDPNIHEAAAHEKGKEGVVIRELSHGYMLGDKIIRPAMVVVGNGLKSEE